MRKISELKSKLILLLFPFVLLAGQGIVSSMKKSVSKSKDNYALLWKRVDSLEQKGLTSSALELVNQLFQRAKSEGNTNNFIRSSIERLKLQANLEEDAYIATMNELETEANQAIYPTKQILYSALAEAYWNYYQNHRYEMLQRTATQVKPGNDIRTWSLNELRNHIHDFYQLSLAESGKSQVEKLSDFDAILILERESKFYRPTLYDFLAHRAIEYYMNDELDEVKAINNFELNNASYFKPSSEFVKLKITSKDSASAQLKAIRIFQQLELFHSGDKTKQAMADVELLRLKYVRQRYAQPEKDSLYLAALINAGQIYSGKDAAAFEYEQANYFWELGNQESEDQALKGSYLKKSLQLCDKVISIYATTGAAKSSIYLKQLLLEKSMNISIEEVQIPNQPILAALRFKNTKKVFLKLVKMPEGEGLEIHRWINPETQKSILKQQALSSWSLDLPDDGDLLEHGIQFDIQALGAGHYCLLAATDEKFSGVKNGFALSAFWVCSISFISNRLVSGDYEGYVLDRSNGRALTNVSIVSWKEQYDYKKRNYSYIKGSEIKSKEDGYFRLPFKEGERNVFLEFKKDDADRFVSGQGFYLYKNPSPNEEEAQLSCFLFTDRKIYRPGQTVFFKGIVLEKKGKKQNSVAGQSSEITLYDVNGQVVETLKVTSNAYGSFQGKFQLPTGLMNGQMTIGNGFGSNYFMVEEYKRPKFMVDINPLTKAYQLGDSVIVSGFAKEYSGLLLQSAQVNYRVVRKAIYPLWFASRMYPDAENAAEIAHGTSFTNSNGQFKLSFKALAGKLSGRRGEKNFNYSVMVDVTDRNGETQSNQIEVNIGESSILLQADLPDKIEKHQETKIQIQAHNLNGNAIACEGKFKIYQLEKPVFNYRERKWIKPDRTVMSEEKFHQLFPKDEFMDESDTKYLKQKKLVYEVTFSTDTNQKTKTSNFTPSEMAAWESGIYSWEATTIDDKGKQIKIENRFVLFSMEDAKVPVKAINFFAASANQYEPGAYATLAIGTSEKDVRVLFELESSSGIEKQEWMELNDEIKKVTIPITEQYRGNIEVRMTFIHSNRVYENKQLIEVPFSNKDLQIRFETERKYLSPGKQEQWKLILKPKTGSLKTAEFLATMYDASLDKFLANTWSFNPNSYFSASRNWESSHSFQLITLSAAGKDWNTYSAPYYQLYDRLNWYGFEGGSNYHYARGGMVFSTMAPMESSMQMSADGASSQRGGKSGRSTANKGEEGESTKKDKTASIDLSTGEKERAQNKLRSNFAETAFFLPNVYSNDQGEVELTFTVPDALTTWKFMGFAHTKDLSFGSIERKFVAQKELMTTLNLPRFLREGDEVNIPVKVGNLSSKKLAGIVNLRFYDVHDRIDISEKLLKENAEKKFDVSANESQIFTWKTIIPDGLEAIVVRVSGNTGSFSDAEEMVIPVLPKRSLVTETMPIWMKAGDSKEFIFEKMMHQQESSKSLKNYRVTFEMSTNPIWYAVQSLPYLMQTENESTDGLFTRYYANSIAKHLMTSNSKIKTVFEKWKLNASSNGDDYLFSNLEKNQELKAVLLQETPWVMDAKNETERQRRIASIFDVKNTESQQKEMLAKLQERQLPNGAWSWIQGMPDDEFITLQIVGGFGHLKNLEVLSQTEREEVGEMINTALNYLDERMKERYELSIKRKGFDKSLRNLGQIEIHYLYVRSFFKDTPIQSGNEKAFHFYLAQAKKYWLDNSRFLQGMIALSLHRFDEHETAVDVLKSLKENSLYSQEMGRYWKESNRNYSWYDAPIEMQSVMIEAFAEIEKDKQTVEELKVWLLRNKQTNGWDTDKATSDACYALLSQGEDWLNNPVTIEAKIGSEKIKSEELGDEMGYIKKSWTGAEINAAMSKINIKTKSVAKTSSQILWGALYWQYFDDYERITQSSSSLKVDKKYFKLTNTDKGPILTTINDVNQIKVGDKIKVRLEIMSDRPMEYVFLKDLRGAGLEQKEVLSVYKYQDGLSYYQSVKDASVHIYFDRLPKGTHILEYELVAEQEGQFNNGLATIQCHYSPEFTGHSSGSTIRISK